MGGERALPDLLLSAARLDLQPPPVAMRQAVARLSPDALLEAADHHRLASQLHLRLRESESLSPEAARGLAERYLLAVATHLQALAQLKTLTGWFESAGIECISFKGPVLSEVYYPRPDLRAYADLDVLVRPAKAREAFDLLLDQGGRPRGFGWEQTQVEQIAQISLQLPTSIVVDLHWHPFSLVEVRQNYPLDPDDLLDRSRSVDVTKGTVRTLSVEDTLLHLCAHTSFSGGTRLSWFTDIAQVLRAGGIDWDQFAARARRARLSLIAATMLERTRHLLGSDVPAQALDGLAPRYGWRQVMRTAEQVRPLPRTSSGRVTGELVVLSTAGSSRESVAALSRRTWTDLIRPLATDPDHPWRQRARAWAANRNKNPQI